MNQQVEDDWDEEEPLPASLWVFASPALDHDEAIARRAADLIYSVHRHLVHGFINLERMERALREAVPVSARAREARDEIRRAIAGFGEVVGGTDKARGALIFHWKPEVGNVA